MDSQREIFLFRHGKTIANENRLYCGKTDLALSEKGRAELLKKRSDSDSGRKSYPNLSHCKIYTSPLKRVTQSLRILYPECADSTIEEKAFQEIDFGDFEMKSYDELKDDEAYRAWVQNEVDRIQSKDEHFPENPCPNGESHAKMNERVLVVLQKILQNERSVAIFTHGGVISAIMSHFFPNERKSVYEWQPDFGEGYKITLCHFDGKLSPRLERSEMERSFYKRIP